MKFQFGFLILTLTFGATLSQADTTLPVVMRYKEAANPKVWNSKTHLFRNENPLPIALIEKVKIADPSLAFRQPYSNVFLQNERIVVCNQECEQPQNLQVSQQGKNFEVALSVGSSRKTIQANDSLIRQATVYYWVNRLFERMEQLGYTPTKRLVVYVDRVAKDAESGVVEDNNAFFNDKDWTLSFLPAANSFFTLLTAQGFHFASAYDPSVAMHETTNSVFDDIIGPILNHEILGLHEAFADYFAMSILDSPAIGRIMLKGKALRDASVPAKYEAEMEAHDLGHVVGSALWSLRQLFTDKLLADRVALETIREVSRNPFATAASVSEGYLTALAKFSSDSALVLEARKIWAATGLAVSKVDVNTDALAGKISSGKYVVTSFVLTVPDWVVVKMGLKKEEKLTIGVIETRPGPDKKTEWVLVSTQDEKVATAYWLLYSHQSKSVLAAYDLTLSPVTSGLSEIGGALGEALEWNQDFGKKVRDTFVEQLQPRKIGPVPIFPATRKDHRTSGFVSINNRVLAATGHYVKIRAPILPLKLLMQAVLGKHYAQLQSVRAIRLITVASGALADKQLLEAFPGEKLVGYEIISRTGVSKKVMLEGIAEGK